MLHHDGVGRDKVLVLVTDAQVSAEAATRNAVASALGDAQLYVVGIDEAVNAGLCRDLAALGGGRFDLVTRPEEVMLSIERIVHRVGRPLARSLHIAGAPAGSSLPRHGADRYAGAPTTLWAAVDAHPTGRRTSRSRGRRRPDCGGGLPHRRHGLRRPAPPAELGRRRVHPAGARSRPRAVDAAERAAAISLAARRRAATPRSSRLDHAGERAPGRSRPAVQPLAEVHGWAGGAMTFAAALGPLAGRRGPGHRCGATFAQAARSAPRRGPPRGAFTSAATPERSGPPIVAIPPARPPAPGSISAALRRRVLAVLMSSTPTGPGGAGRWPLAPGPQPPRCRRRCARHWSDSPWSWPTPLRRGRA